LDKLKRLIKIALSVAPAVFALLSIGWSVGTSFDMHTGLGAVCALVCLDLTLTAHTIKTKGGS
jgi:hypothetical protein